MTVGLGPRFALEAGFLILLAVVVGIADLEPAVIVGVMAIAWLLVSLIEYLAWRQGPRVEVARRFSPATEPAPVVEVDVIEEVADVPPPPLPPPLPPPMPPLAEEQTMVEPPPPPVSEEPLPPAAADEPSAMLRPTGPQRAPHKLEPLQPRPRRRWMLFGPRQRPKEQADRPAESPPAEDSNAEER